MVNYVTRITSRCIAAGWRATKLRLAVVRLCSVNQFVFQRTGRSRAALTVFLCLQHA
jgi:hypothetical protein